MNNPGSYSLGVIGITSAGTQITTAVTDLDGMTALSLQISLAYGSGGTSALAFVQTSLDGGNTWTDIACVSFATAGATKVVNLSGLTSRTTELTPTDGALASDTFVDGVLGDRLRVKVINTGTYSGNTVLSAFAVAR
jgi:hypothetical protein